MLSISQRAMLALLGGTLVPLMLLLTGCSPADSGVLSSSGAEAAAPLPIDEVQQMLRGWMFAHYPELPSTSTFPVYERTTDEIWERLGVQIVQIYDGPQQYEAFGIVGDRIDPIGIAFGGFGLNSFCVCDLDSDGLPELAHTYSWGSGIHRAQVALYHPQIPERPSIPARLAYFHGDLVLEKVSDIDVRVWTAHYAEGDVNGYVPDVMIGSLRIDDSGPWPELVVDLETDLPDAVLDNIVE